jgi:two-component system, response regulator
MNLRQILLVDAHGGDIEMVKQTISAARYPNQVVVIEDGRAALDYLFCIGDYAGRRLSDLPEFVLLELKLPTMDGIEFLRNLRSGQPAFRIPVIVFTSSDDERDVATCYDLHASSFIRKPADEVRHRELIGHICRYWLELNQPPPLSV